MAGFARKKRVTDSFDDAARARLVCFDRRPRSSVGSVSEHFVDGNRDGDSFSLSELVHGFLENHVNGHDDANDDSAGYEFDSERFDSVDDSGDLLEDPLKWRSAVSFPQNADPYRTKLLAHVSEGAEEFAFLRDRNVSVFRRSVAAFLREKGHDAAVCKTAWDSSAEGVTAGSHEFIDVVQQGPSTWRYFVELDFRAQFEIARPTPRFSEVLGSVPGVFVGGAEELKRTVSMVCDAARRCFRSEGLSVPPWRKKRFMLNKWLAPSRRTAKPVKGNPVPVVVTAVNSVGCRLVGFEDVVLGATRRGGGVTVRTG